MKILISVIVYSGPNEAGRLAGTSDVSLEVPDNQNSIDFGDVVNLATAQAIIRHREKVEIDEKEKQEVNPE